MKVLVLGSHGTVGISVCKYFQEKGHTVIPWDIKFSVTCDLRIAGNLDTILPTVDFVLFLAFDVGGSKYNINSIDYINNNVKILMNTFTSLSICPRPFIHTTSQMSSMNHNSYGVLKRLAEMYTTH
jgi:nucleoside-diphosphate-sugar epimerase